MARKLKAPIKTYGIDITEEHIKLMRSLSLRMDMMWLSKDATRTLDDEGNIEWVILYRCEFCNRGSFESAQSIPHEKDCIVPFHERVWDGLNEQFMAAEIESQQG